MRRQSRHVLAVASALLLLTGCAQVLVAAPEAPVVASSGAPDVDPPAPQAPGGRIVVAYPDPVGTSWGRDAQDVAAVDLAALWGLPLYRVDDLGRRIPALATTAHTRTTPTGWEVEVDLAAGSWSDGAPVTARDVVRSAEVLAEARPAAWGSFTSAAAVDDDTAVLTFTEPYARWAALLSEAPGVLPAHVLDEGGLEAFAGVPPVTGGSFTVTAHEDGLRTVFAAAVGSPLGPAALAEVEVLVVPSGEVALGLLDRGEVDVVAGYVLLDPSARVARVDGVEVGTRFGGTRFELAWDARTTAVGTRRAAAAAVDPGPFVEGLLRDAGRPAAGVRTGLRPVPVQDAGDAGGEEVAVLVPRTVEGLGLLARLVQASLVNVGVETSLVRVDPPEHLAPPVPVDGQLRLVRTAPDRSIGAVLAEAGIDPAPGVRADGAVATGDPAGEPSGLTAAADLDAVLREDPVLLPLAEVAVTHAWRSAQVHGVRPSAWPGVAFWSAATWRVPTDAG